MPGHPYVLAETNWKSVKGASFEVAILSWGATEAHNYHLPYGTDVYESDYIAAESARIAWEAGAKVIVLPTVPYGVNTTQLEIPLTINMNPSTQLALLRDVVDSLHRQRIGKLLLLNSHGGNDFRQMIRELKPQFPNILVCTLNWYQLLDQDDFFDERGDHAGEMETSVMLHIVPDLVLPLTEAGSGRSKKFKLRLLRERKVWAPREWMKSTDDTGVGNPSKATAEKGERYLAALTKEIGNFLVELAAADVNDLYE